MTRTDLDRPDWFRDPVTGRRSDPDQYAFRVDHRHEEQTGNVKQVWEIARLQHLTLLATAWALTGTTAMPGGWMSSCAHGGRRTRSCPGSTGPAASRSVSG